MHAHPDSRGGDVDTVPRELRYDCEPSRLPPPLAEQLAELSCDPAAREFLATVGAAPHGRLRTALYRGLRRVMSDFDAYGLLDMYRVHLLSTTQLRRLLQLEDGATVATWLDIGAGNGAAIDAARPLLQQLHVTEASAVLRRKLASQGARVHAVDLCEQPIDTPQGGFDVVSCLNVLDRCLYPRTMLQHARDALAPGGRLIIALALPLRPHVDMGGHSVDQEQPLPVHDDDLDWEACAARLWEQLLAPAGLQLSSLSRAPYISQGDAGGALHVLDDALFVCRAVV